MLEVADIIRLHGAAYLARFNDRLLPSHKRALQELQCCRTPHVGGHVYQCDHCGETRYMYHSCRHRSCPTCHREQTARWLAQQRAHLLPCAHFLLGRYVFRIAISNSRLERIEDGQVTFRARDNRTQALRRVTLSVAEFLHRFLQHVLPRGCTKVRYYGLWSPTCRGHFEHTRTLLSAPPPAAALAPVASPASPPLPARCPQCQVGTLILVEVLRPQRSRPVCVPRTGRSP